jgi:hypothetical protein
MYTNTIITRDEVNIRAQLLLSLDASKEKVRFKLPCASNYLVSVKVPSNKIVIIRFTNNYMQYPKNVGVRKAN